MSVTLSESTRNALADAVTTEADSGTGSATISIYSGTRPSGTLLATFTLSKPSFAAATSGKITLNNVPFSTTGEADGDAGWFRLASSAAAAVVDGTVTLQGGGGDMVLDNTSITTGQTVRLTSGSVTMPAS